MDQIKYQFGDIETAAADIRATAGSMNALLDDLKQQLRPWFQRGKAIPHLPTKQPRPSGIAQPQS